MAARKAKRLDDERLLATVEDRAKHDLLTFLALVWWMPQPLAIGRHTRAICDRLTKAVDDFERGISTKLIIDVPPRHGKSDIVSRAFPAWFLGRCSARQPSIIEASYDAEMAQQFSFIVRSRILQCQEYREIFPTVYVSNEKSSIGTWRVAASSGTYRAIGVKGGITGSDADLEIIDDPFKDELQVKSQSERTAVIRNFATALNTRLSPVSIQIVMNTRWAINDLTGWILQKMKDDPAFPRYEHISFPARKDGPDGYDYLFPERFLPEWYDGQRATMTKAMASAMLDCSPRPEGGNRFNVANIHWHDSLDAFPQGQEIRAWDLASSDTQRQGTDPDWTFGVKGQVTTAELKGGAQKRTLWISDIVAIRAEAPKRNELIRRTAIKDGESVKQTVEAFGAYKDAYTEMRDALMGVRVVSKSQMSGDKTAKAAPLEAPFEAGEVHIYRGTTAPIVMDEFIKQFDAFPDPSVHDDAVDATAIMYHTALQGRAAAGYISANDRENDGYYRGR